MPCSLSPEHVTHRATGAAGGEGVGVAFTYKELLQVNKKRAKIPTEIRVKGVSRQFTENEMEVLSTRENMKNRN